MSDKLPKDTDVSPQSPHHTIGPGPNQVNSATHTHDGANSRQIATGVVLTGSRGGGAALVSVIAALVSLGATDSTTP